MNLSSSYKVSNNFIRRIAFSLSIICIFLSTIIVNGQNDQKKLNTVKKRKSSANTQMKNYSGDRVVKKAGSGRKGPRNNSYVQRSQDRSLKTSQKLQKYTGDKRVQESRVQPPRNPGGMVSLDKKTQVTTAKKMRKYQGDIAVGPSSRSQGPRNQTSFVARDLNESRKTSKKISRYQGDMVPGESRMEGPRNSGAMVVATEIDRKQAKKVANYEGDIPTNYLEKRAKYIRKKDKKNANYTGDLLVKNIRAQQRKARIKGKKIANYQGDIVIKRRKGSQVYSGGRVKNSYTKQEKQRMRMMRKSRKKEGNEENAPTKEKNSKYRNKKESEIWY